MMGNDKLQMIEEMKKKARETNNYIEKMSLYYKAAELGDIEAIKETVILAPSIYQCGWAEECGISIDKILEYINSLSNTDDIVIVRSISDFYGFQRKYEEAVKYLKKAATFNDTSAMMEIGDLYYLGDDFGGGILKEDYQEAFYWYMKAAKAGFSAGMKQVGMMYYKGRGVEKDKKKGLKWTLRALITDARNGDRTSMCSIAEMYYEGELIKQNYQKALKWYSEAAKRNYAKPMYKIGDMFKSGKGVKQDYKIAMEWYKKASSMALTNDVTIAMDKIAMMYENGEGVEQNFAEALFWYQRAAAKNDEFAKNKLKEFKEEGLIDTVNE